ETYTKGEKTAQRILDVAEELFAHQGYQATTLRDIAHAAGLREPGLYNHFANKEALYNAVLERGLRPLETQINQLLAGKPDLMTLVKLPGEMLRLNARHPHLSALFYQAIQCFHQGSPAAGAADWILRLCSLGQSMNRELMPGDDDVIILKIIATFNLCCGYFLAQPLLKEWAGIDALDEEILVKQQHLMEQVMRTFVIG
ncbi:MAG: TetR/AcrR family transcriptional regulator, partial [Proteobacteria bacterium]|nr:TetR/AcrR family transcriptional regulator [Pseudomonadota bacterium]